jgi:hypothetical protein
MQFVENDSAFITQADFGRFLGVSRGTAKKYLAGLEAIDGRYYYVPDVADHLWSLVTRGDAK